MRLIWIGLASFFGGISRYLVGGWVDRFSQGPFPWGTFAVNASGSFLLGFIFTALTERFSTDPDLRVALTVGFIGAYTTFSTFAFETLKLGQDGAILLSILNAIGSIAVGLVCVLVGVVAARAL